MYVPLYHNSTKNRILWSWKMLKYGCIFCNPPSSSRVIFHSTMPALAVLMVLPWWTFKTSINQHSTAITSAYLPSSCCLWMVLPMANIKNLLWSSWGKSCLLMCTITCAYEHTASKTLDQKTTPLLCALLCLNMTKRQCGISWPAMAETGMSTHTVETLMHSELVNRLFDVVRKKEVWKQG